MENKGAMQGVPEIVNFTLTKKQNASTYQITCISAQNTIAV
jgi:hypothetical protein